MPQGGTGAPSPLFSVIVATYNRGSHIKPTLCSALEQTVDDVEIIVVADGCSDDTIDVIRSIGSPRISVYELATNSGSQAEPNNLGIARSRGKFIAYLGHDDIWQPGHLAEIANVFARTGADVVASGCIFHGPQNSGICFITGFLDDEHAPSDHFLPPSALAHARHLVDRIGGWRDPDDISPPVDCDFMLRAVRDGARFASTGKITVHKFAAGHRYLSYLTPASAEQEVMLSAVRALGPSEWDSLVDAARRQGRFMAMKYSAYEIFKRGHLHRQNRANKGLRLPKLRELGRTAVLGQNAEPRGLDWHALEGSVRRFRWSGPSPKPRILVPFKREGRARLVLDVLAATPDEVVEALSFDHEGRTVPHAITSVAPHARRIELELPLKADDYSVLGLTTPRMFCPADRTRGDPDTRVLGIALGDIVLDTVER